MVIYLTALLNFMANLISLIGFFKAFPKRIRKETYGLLGALLLYYIFWWVSPKFLLDFFFYLNIYVTSPLFAIGSLMFTGFLVFSVGFLAALSLK